MLSVEGYKSIIEAHIRLNQPNEARQRLEAAGSLLPESTQTELRDKIAQCASNALSLGEPPSSKCQRASRKRKRSPSLGETQELQTNWILNTDCVSIIASFEGFTEEHSLEKRVATLFQVFCGSYDHSNLQDALRNQMAELSTFPDHIAMGFYIGVELDQTDPHFFHHFESKQKDQRNDYDFTTVETVCKTASGLLEIIKRKTPLNYMDMARTLSQFLPDDGDEEVRMFRDEKFNGNQLQLPDDVFLPHLRYCSTSNCPILSLVLTYFQHEPLRVHLRITDPFAPSKESLPFYYDLLPCNNSNYKWKLQRVVGGHGTGFERICRTFFNCHVECSQKFIDMALATAIFNLPFNREYADFLIRQGADIQNDDEINEGGASALAGIRDDVNGGVREVNLETQISLLEFFFSQKLDDHILECILGELKRPIKSQMMELIFAYGKKHPDVFIEAMNSSFYGFCNPAEGKRGTLFRENNRSELIFANALLDFWLKIDPKIQKELSSLFFMSLLNEANPVTDLLEKSHGLKIMAISDELIFFLLKWIREVHIKCVKNEDYNRRDTLIRTSIKNLLMNLEKRGIRYSLQELVAALKGQIDNLDRDDPLNKMMGQITQNRNFLGIVGIIDGLLT